MIAGAVQGGAPWRRETGYRCFVWLRSWCWQAAWRTAGTEPSRMIVALEALLGEGYSVRGSKLVRRRRRVSR